MEQTVGKQKARDRQWLKGTLTILGYVHVYVNVCMNAHVHEIPGVQKNLLKQVKTFEKKCEFCGILPLLSSCTQCHSPHDSCEDRARTTRDVNFSRLR